MNERTWHKGPPPHIGWWNAAKFRFDDCWRWWDGTGWSYAVYDDATAKEAGVAASKPAPSDAQSRIEWTDFYPDNARVPRIDPGVSL